MKEQLVRLLGLESAPVQGEVQQVPLEALKSNPFQPRREFPPEELEELASSIRTHGVLQPVVARPGEDGFEIVAGERRVRACRILGWATVPAVVQDLGDQDVALFALVENLQREDLSCLEEARGYRRLLDEFGLTQEALAQRVGKNQSTVANKLRLLKLPEKVQDFISRGIISERHARALLKLEEEEAMISMSEQIAAEELTVKEAEARILEVLQPGQKGSEGAGASVETGEPEKGAPREGVAGGRRVSGGIGDLRVLRNTVQKTVSEIEAAGFGVEWEENEGEQWVEFRVRVSIGNERSEEAGETEVKEENEETEEPKEAEETVEG